MKWIDIDFNRDHDVLFTSPDGNRSSYFRKEINGEYYWGKVFNDPTDDKRKVIDRFQGLSYEGVHAFPVGRVYYHNKVIGYLSNQCFGSVSFCDDLAFLYPYNIRYQASLDVSSQLRFLHQNGFIVNDVRCSNNLLLFHDKHGVMIDFEDMILEDDYQDKPTYYRFYLDDQHLVSEGASKHLDTRKQFICNTSLLLGNNLEEKFIVHGKTEFLKSISFDREVLEFANELFCGKSTLYFDEIAPRFQDEEKVKSYVKNII